MFFASQIVTNRPPKYKLLLIAPSTWKNAHRGAISPPLRTTGINPKCNILTYLILITLGHSLLPLFKVFFSFQNFHTQSPLLQFTKDVRGYSKQGQQLERKKGFDQSDSDSDSDDEKIKKNHRVSSILIKNKHQKCVVKSIYFI